MTGFEPRTSRYIENDRSTNWATTALLIYYLLFKTDKSRHLYFFFGGGAWCESSGQCARFLHWRSEFESRWSLQILFYVIVWKEAVYIM